MSVVTIEVKRLDRKSWHAKVDAAASVEDLKRELEELGAGEARCMRLCQNGTCHEVDDGTIVSSLEVAATGNGYLVLLLNKRKTRTKAFEGDPHVPKAKQTTRAEREALLQAEFEAKISAREAQLQARLRAREEELHRTLEAELGESEAAKQVRAWSSECASQYPPTPAQIWQGVIAKEANGQENGKNYYESPQNQTRVCCMWLRTELFSARERGDGRASTIHEGKAGEPDACACLSSSPETASDLFATFLGKDDAHSSQAKTEHDTHSDKGGSGEEAQEGFVWPSLG